MHNNLFSIKISILSLSLIGHSIFASQVIEKDAFDRGTCLKLAMVGTICIGGYCIYNLWHANKELKNNNKSLGEELSALKHSNQFLVEEKKCWQNQAEQEKKTNFNLHRSLKNYQQELNEYKRLLCEEREEHQLTQAKLDHCQKTIHRLTTFHDFSSSDEESYYSFDSLSPRIMPTA